MNSITLERIRQELIQEARIKSSFTDKDFYDIKLATARSMLNIVSGKYQEKYRNQIQEYTRIIETLDRKRPYQRGRGELWPEEGKQIRLFFGMFTAKIRRCYGPHGPGISIALALEHGKTDSADIDRSGRVDDGRRPAPILADKAAIDKAYEGMRDWRQKESAMRQITGENCIERIIEEEYYRYGKFPLEHVTHVVRDMMVQLIDGNKMAEVIALQAAETMAGRSRR